LNWNPWIRQVHRWTSIVFVAVVIFIFVMLGMGRQPASWVYLLPLLPLALLALTGLYLFALPYAARARSGG
jgi:ABC-type polysaccharide/polyol phosphate export permease